jgi:hypothetical protein
VLLPVPGGAPALIDADVAERLAGRKFYQSKRGYVQTARGEYLHHLVVGKPPRGWHTDHINGDRSDNRRRNLRHVSPSCNGRNVRRVWGQVPWRGVTRVRRRFMAEGGGGAKRRTIQSFGSALLAAFAYDDLTQRIFGTRDGLNFRHFIRRADLGGFLRATKGRIFNVLFVRRRDGALRAMTCRTDVRKNVKGQQLAFEPEEKGLLSVYDLRQRNYRFIPLENVLCLTCAGKRFRVVA